MDGCKISPLISSNYYDLIYEQKDTSRGLVTSRPCLKVRIKRVTWIRDSDAEQAPTLV
jgi:hypothetical protein